MEIRCDHLSIFRVVERCELLPEVKMVLLLQHKYAAHMILHLATTSRAPLLLEGVGIVLVVMVVVVTVIVVVVDVAAAAVLVNVKDGDVAVASSAAAIDVAGCKD
jgi:hypothetical protein